MDDPKLKAQGKGLIQHYGCAGCHEISGMETKGVSERNSRTKEASRLSGWILLSTPRTPSWAFFPTAKNRHAAHGTI